MIRLVLAALALAGCAHAQPDAMAPQVVVDLRTESIAPRERAAAPQRLDRVVTLGHDAFLPGARSGTAQGSAAPVVIQNNITVNQTPSYGYGYGYSYGGYRYAAPTYSTPRSVPVNPVTGTPPVAGDWPAPPSYGPRPMR